MATHSSILTWKSHGQRSLAGWSPWGCKELGAMECVRARTHTHTHTHTHTEFHLFLRQVFSEDAALFKDHVLAMKMTESLLSMSLRFSMGHRLQIHK